MKKLKISLILLFFSLSKCFGQDTLRYRLINSPYFSEDYSFCRDSIGSSTGVFARIMFTDDGQKFAGKGRFTETKRKFILSPFTYIRTAAWIKPDGKPFNGITNDTLLIPSLILFKRDNKLILGTKGRMIYVPILHH